MVVFIKKVVQTVYCDLFTNILFVLFCMKVIAEEKSLSTGITNLQFTSN